MNTAKAAKYWIGIALLAISLGALGCKQGIGERCQVSDDCEEGVCSSSEPKVCVTSNTGSAPIDAEAPVDAPAP